MSDNKGKNESETLDFELISECVDEKLSTNNKEFNEFREKICNIIPRLNNDRHKGQAGRIGIIGGSMEYTGAPYFSAISSLKTGADLCYVFCTSDSAPVIKSYCPELIVYPILDRPTFLQEFLVILPKLHALVIGPGLGRNEDILSNLGLVISELKEKKVPAVFDADALYFLSRCPNFLFDYTEAILTPNEVEFNRLFSSLLHSEAKGDSKLAVESLAKKFGNVTILKKGQEDIISNGLITYTCKEPGSPRRCGGQGDLLSGALGTFSYWSHQAFGSSRSSFFPQYTPAILACLAASMLTRRCANLAFQKYSRSTITNDMIKEIHKAFSSLYPVD